MIAHMMFISSLVLGGLLVVIPHLIWLVVWLVGRCCDFSVPYSPFGWTALGLVLLCWSILAYGFFVGRFRVEIKHVDYTHTVIPPAFKGYKIVHISDLHLSTFDDRPSALQRLVDSINAQQPDLICFTGDLVTMGVSEAAPYRDILRRLHATDGIVSVLGNHDMLIYRRWASEAERESEVAKLVDFERNELEWHLLRNQHLNIVRDNDTLTIVGVDNCACKNQGFRTIHAGDLSQAMADTDGFRILLSHDPTHWRAEVLSKTDIPLTLSGHTHAAQVRLFGWTPAAWSFRETAGRYDSAGQTLYVNVGLGCTLPVRINCPAEITVITLQ
ncbi:MAG: metallophosphoesterase [Paludibacteraceae bacterium]